MDFLDPDSKEWQNYSHENVQWSVKSFSELIKNEQVKFEHYNYKKL